MLATPIVINTPIGTKMKNSFMTECQKTRIGQASIWRRGRSIHCGCLGEIGSWPRKDAQLRKIIKAPSKEAKCSFKKKIKDAQVRRNENI